MITIMAPKNVLRADYERGSERDLSFTFTNEVQNKLIVNGLQWLGTGGTD
jgi:hypothetical protein